MKSVTRLVIAAAAVFALAALRPAHEDVKPTDLGNGAEFKGKKIEMNDRARSLTFCPSPRGRSSTPLRTARRTPT